MKHIKFIALILSVLAIFCCSCGDTKQRRLHKLYYSSSTNTYKPEDSTIYIKRVDTTYHTGDIILESDDYGIEKHYIIVD